MLSCTIMWVSVSISVSQSNPHVHILKQILPSSIFSLKIWRRICIYVLSFSSWNEQTSPCHMINILFLHLHQFPHLTLLYITYAELQEGRFFLQDRRSSNGTMVYLQEPLELPFSHPVRLRMGRSTLSIQAKRNWLTSVRGAFGTIRSTLTHPTPEELMTVFSLSNMGSR